MRCIKLGHLAELNRWWSKRAGFCALALAVHCLVFTSPIPSYSASEETLKATIVYHLGNVMSVAEAGAFMALNRGYFDNEGLSVQIVEGAIDRQSADLVTDNPNAIGVASVFDFLRARAAGRHLVAFASA